MIRNTSRLSLPEPGMSARSGPAYSSSKSKMAADSINVSPSGWTKVGTRPNELNCRISSKSLPTDQLRCSNSIPSSFMLTATLRTKGESNIPMRIKRRCLQKKRLMATLDQQPRRGKGLRQLLLDAHSLRAFDVLQMQSRSGQHLDA